LVRELKFSDQEVKSFESLAWAELIKCGITKEKRVEEKQGECICPLSWSYATTLLFMVDRVKGGRVCAPPPPPPSTRMG
jgi:hypothetical protein